jgi:hypothetical protein
MRLCADQCKVCPFRRTSAPGWLGGYRNLEVVQAAWDGKPFFCHSRMNYQRPNWLEYAMRNGQLCLGFLLAIKRWKFPEPKDPLILKAYQDALVYESKVQILGHSLDIMTPQEFLLHHKDQAYLDNKLLQRELADG